LASYIVFGIGSAFLGVGLLMPASFVGYLLVGGVVFVGIATGPVRRRKSASEYDRSAQFHELLASNDGFRIRNALVSHSPKSPNMR
jgi:hypothetical protein